LTVERTTTHIADNSGRIAMLEVLTQGSDSNALELKRFVYSNHLGSFTLNFFVHIYLKVNLIFVNYSEKEINKTILNYDKKRDNNNANFCCF
jgi:hypothetical protein